MLSDLSKKIRQHSERITIYVKEGKFEMATYYVIHRKFLMNEYAKRIGCSKPMFSYDRKER